RYPDSQNTVIPHHIYQYTYKEDISVERARQYLNLSQDAFIVTAFGKFRNREEIRMVLGAFRSWNEERKMLLAPRLYPFSRHNNYGRNFLKRWISRAGYYLFMPLFNRIYKLQAGANDELIDNCDLPYYMAASDVIFIQRKDILNSGNVPLAFLYHKVVVGPKVGNIGELLSETGNPTFNPDNKKDILRALEEARRLAAWGQGEVNYTYGMENMSIHKVGQAYAQTYKQAING
ncbi:glycosyltransferase family 1 protein, partial [Bacteroides ovatus]